MFRKMFGRRGGEPPRQEPAPDPFAALPWLERHENPFGIRVLDCRPFTRGMISTTSDPAIARRFLELRQSDGSDQRGARPQEPVETACELVFPSDGRSAGGPLFKAQEMEDKWDVYLYDDVLYFAELARP